MRSTILPSALPSALVLVSASFVSCMALGCFAQQRDQEALSARVAEAEKQAQQSREETQRLRADLEATRQRLDNALRASADSSSDLISSKQRVNELSGRVDEMSHAIDDVKRDVAASRTEIYARIDDLKRQAPASPPPAAVVVPADKATHYKQLEETFAKKDWASVRILGVEYVNRYATDERADDALYLVGAADLSDGRPSSALGQFNKLLKLFPKSNVLDKTLFGMGESYMTMHDCANARLAFDACEKRFSKDKIGAEARARIAAIGQNAPGLCAPQ